MSTIDGVWLLTHSHENSYGDEEVKTIGVFASEQEAERACLGLKGKPGFRDSPRGFHWERWTLGKVAWEEGFISVAEAMES